MRRGLGAMAGPPVAAGRKEPRMIQNVPLPENEIRSLKAQLQQSQNQIGNMYSMIEDLQERGSVAFPEQFKMGIIRFPHLYLRPFDWVAEVLEHGSDPYATTAGIATATFDFGSVFSFVNRLSFSLVRVSAPEQSPLPINTHLPLSCQNHPFIADDEVYVGHDFDFRISGLTEGVQFENDSRWRASKEADTPDGFVFDGEYEALPGDVLTVQVRPFAAAAENEEFRLIAYLHGYKMVTKSEGFNAVS